MRWHLILQNVMHLKLILQVNRFNKIYRKTRNIKPPKIRKKFKFLFAKAVNENLELIGNNFKNVKSISFPFAFILEFGGEN